MKKYSYLFRVNFLPLVALTLLTATLLTSCGPSIYKANDFKAVAKTHKTVAVIPFDVIIESRKLPKNVTLEMIQKQQTDNGYAIQSNVYTYLLREQSKDRYTIEVQDVDKTNSLLKKAGLTYEDLRTTSKEELAALLNVDAIISGKVNMAKPMSDGAAIAVGLLVGAWGNTNKVSTALTIHERQAGKLMWKYDYQAAGSVGSNAESLTKALMKNVSKKFPYRS